jgi:hypothetical protein
LRYLADAAQAVSAKDYPRTIVDLVAAMKLIDREHPIPGDVLRYAEVLAELAVAKDSDEAKHVIVAAAVPVGSWRAKREPGKVTFAINGYLGFQVGREWLGSADLPRAPSWSYGLFAPIGIEASRGLGKTAGSIGVLLTLLDLGALLQFRSESSDAEVSNGTSTVRTERAPAYTFKEVFSPGLFLRYGLGQVPVVFGVGASITPELRRVTVIENNTRRDLPAFHVGVFVSLVDLTILPF